MQQKHFSLISFGYLFISDIQFGYKTDIYVQTHTFINMQNAFIQ